MADSNSNPNAQDDTPIDQNDDITPSEVIIPDDVEAIIEDLPPNKKEVVKGMFIRMMVKKSFSGPLPHPSILKEYEDILPGCAERIIARMEKQSDHRMEMESFVTKEDQKQSGNGRKFGFVIAIFGLLLSGFLIYTGHDTAGTILGGTDLIALVSVFVYGKYAQRKDLDDSE